MRRDLLNMYLMLALKGNELKSKQISHDILYHEGTNRVQLINIKDQVLNTLSI